MLFSNLTPFLIGAKVTSRHPPQPEMTLVVRARYLISADGALQLSEEPYPLGQGRLSAEAFAEDDEDGAGECLYPGDFADYKLHAEVTLRGSCHTPGGRPLTECPVRFSVGGWSKTLRVLGPRVWVDSVAGSIPSDPVPFTRMPLGWSSSFGGPGHAPNPVGKGLGTRELPSVESPAEPIHSRRDRPAPAGFGPISSRWAARAGKVGKAYGEGYRKRRSPFYAEDFDWTYFHAAPADQQIEGYLRGDEEVSFQNLHPRAPLIHARLPALRVRAFVHDKAGRFREAGMSLDTLHADLDEGALYLTWRGLIPVREIDLSDVTTLLFATEPLAAPPLAADVYREKLLDFERDPVNLRAAVPEAYRDLWDRMQAAKAPPADELPAPGLEGVARLLEQRLGAHAAPAVARLRALSAAVEKMPAPPGVDLQALLAKAANDAMKQRPFAIARAPGALPRGALPRLGLGKRLRAALERVEEIKNVAAAQGITLPPTLAELSKVANDPRLRALDPTFRPPGEPEVPEPDPAPGVSASGLDWSGRDLRGADLRGADLTDTVLTGADLRGVKLTGAKLVRAVLFEAEMEGADLSTADLTYANLGGARAEKASFRGATLTRAHLAQTKLAGAVLAGAQGENPILDDADLSGVDARGAALTGAQIERALLDGADFSEARLVECRFVDAGGRGVKLARATLDRSTFQGASLAGASLHGARGEKTVWIRAQLEGADFREADLPNAHFEEARAARALFQAADLPLARFYRAALEGADFSHANLRSVDMRHAQVRKARFCHACLYDGKLQGAAGEGCDFNGTNLKRAVVGMP